MLQLGDSPPSLCASSGWCVCGWIAPLFVRLRLVGGLLPLVSGAWLRVWWALCSIMNYDVGFRICEF